VCVCVCVRAEGLREELVRMAMSAAFLVASGARMCAGGARRAGEVCCVKAVARQTQARALGGVETRFVGARCGARRRTQRSALAMVATEPPRVETSANTWRAASSALPQSAPESAEIALLYDGECHLCLKEVNFLQRKDAGQGKIHFVDIAADDYEPEMYQNISYEEAMGRIHSVCSDGTVLTGVPVFRKLYELVGLGYVYAVTKNRFVGSLAERVYNVWADNRLRLTGRGDLADVIKEREQRIHAKIESAGSADCETSCKIEW